MTEMVRLIWKEYRALRGLWLALAVFGLACDALIFFLVNNPRERLAGCFGFAGALPAGFALGAGAMLFALEREEATYDLLRCLPVTSMRLFASKVLTALAGSLLLALLLAAVALGDVRQIAIRPIVDRDIFSGAFDLVLVYALMVVQGIGWSVFFSLQSARPLLAALLGALGAVTCISLVHFATEGLGFAKLHGTYDAPALHLLATLAVWSVNVWLGSRWLHGRRKFAQLRRTDIDPLRTYQRLLWQEWRGTYRLLIAIVVLGVVVPIVFWPAFIATTVLGVSLLGACTFLADQEARQFRFFAERGVSPRRLWLSRQVFWGSAVLALAAILLIAQRLFVHFALGAAPSEVRRLWQSMGWVFDLPNLVIWVALAFAAGQACSMFFQSGVLAAALGVLLACLFAGWMTAMHTLDVGLWWSAAPLAIALFVATWLRSNGWLLERHTWRAWVLALFLPLMTIATLLVSVPAYRVFEVPEPVTSIEISSPPLPSAAAAFAATRLEGLCMSLHFPHTDLLRPLGHIGDAEPDADQMVWLEKNEDAMKELIVAIDELPRDATIASGDYHRLELRWDGLGAMILRYGQLAERDGKVDEAWRLYQSVFKLAAFVRCENGMIGEATGDNLVTAAAMQLTRWGAHKDQTVAHLRTAIAALKQSEIDDPPLVDVVSNDYRDYVRITDRLLANPETADPQAAFLSKWAPWEVTRLRRLFRYTASLNLLDARVADAELAGRASLPVRRGHQDYSATAARLWRSTMIGPLFETEALVRLRCSAVCHRRAAELGLGAQAWRVEHGALPKSLEQLKGVYFDDLPLDPYTGGNFTWFPWGVSERVRFNKGEAISAGTPFLYSIGLDGNWFPEEQGLEDLRRRSADEPIVPSPPLSGGAPGSAAAVGPAPLGLAPPVAQAMPGGVPATQTVAPPSVADSSIEYLGGLVFPVRVPPSDP